MPEQTTIQVSKETAKILKSLGDTYEGAIKWLIIGAAAQPSEQLDFKMVTPALTTTTEDRFISYDGVITQVIVVFPAGCFDTSNNKYLVDARLKYISPKGRVWYVLPSRDDAYLSLNDTTVTFNISFPVEKGGKLTWEVRNYDGSFSHQVACYAVLIKKPVLK